jgi:hypothetical protein
MIKNILFFLLLICFSNGVAAQASMKWGKVPQSDLEMKTYEADEEADAVILGKYLRTKFEIRGNDEVMVYDYHIRIKILSKAGLDYANIEIPYYSHKNHEKINGIKAATYNLSGKTKLSRKEIFTEETSEWYSQKKFTFPAVEVGSVIEYKYTIVSQSVLIIDDFYFQEDLPIRVSSFRVRVPEFFDYVAMKQMNALFNVETTKSVNMQVQADMNRPGKEFIWEMYNAKAVKEESYITTMNDYRQRIRLQLKTYHFPNGGSKDYFSTWEDTEKKMMAMETFGKRFVKNRNIKPILKLFPELATFKDASKEKMDAIFKFVQENVKWDKSYSIYSNRSSKDVFEAQSGDVGEINLMLLALLKHSGIEAKPILVSTRGHGKPNQHYPILKQFNYIIVQAKIGDETYLLDAVISHMPLGYVSFKCLNQKGWLMSGNGGKWIPIKPAKFMETTQIILNIDEKGGAKGYVSTYYGGYAGINQRTKVNTMKEEDYLQSRIKKDIPNIVIDSIEFKNKEEVDKSFIEKIYFKIDDYAEMGDGIMYINPMLKEGTDENPFKLKERTYPVDLGYLSSEKIIINVFLPKGYELESLPESINMALGEDGGTFRFIVAKAANGSIQIMSTTSLKKPIYQSRDYEFIKQFFDKIIEKQMIQLVAKEVKP